MIKENELDYLSRRLAEERDRADSVLEPAVAYAHRELAALYAKRVADLRAAAPLATEQLIAPQRSISAL